MFSLFTMTGWPIDYFTTKNRKTIDELDSLHNKDKPIGIALRNAAVKTEKVTGHVFGVQKVEKAVKGLEVFNTNQGDKTAQLNFLGRITGNKRPMVLLTNGNCAIQMAAYLDNRVDAKTLVAHPKREVTKRTEKSIWSKPVWDQKLVLENENCDDRHYYSVKSSHHFKVGVFREKKNPNARAFPIRMSLHDGGEKQFEWESTEIPMCSYHGKAKLGEKMMSYLMTDTIKAEQLQDISFSLQGIVSNDDFETHVVFYGMDLKVHKMKAHFGDKTIGEMIKEYEDHLYRKEPYMSSMVRKTLASKKWKQFTYKANLDLGTWELDEGICNELRSLREKYGNVIIQKQAFQYGEEVPSETVKESGVTKLIWK